MATKTKTKGEATGTVQARRALEQQREATANQLRAHHANETKKAQKATAARLKDKPTDSRKLATPDPTAHIVS